MARPKRDPVREERIHQEIIVDAYGPEEQATGRRTRGMTNFKLMKVGQAITVNEFTGIGISQNGHYLQIIGASNDIVVSLNLEPGYYLTNIVALSSNSDLSTAPGGAVSADIQGDAERQNHMAVTDSQTLQRLRRDESLAERQGREASNIAAILKNHPQYDAARQKADSLLAKASALREQIVKIETFDPGSL